MKNNKISHRKHWNFMFAVATILLYAQVFTSQFLEYQCTHNHNVYFNISMPHISIFSLIERLVCYITNTIQLKTHIYPAAAVVVAHAIVIEYWPPISMLWRELMIRPPKRYWMKEHYICVYLYYTRIGWERERDKEKIGKYLWKFMHHCLQWLLELL